MILHHHGRLRSPRHRTPEISLHGLQQDPNGSRDTPVPTVPNRGRAFWRWLARVAVQELAMPGCGRRRARQYPARRGFRSARRRDLAGPAGRGTPSQSMWQCLRARQRLPPTQVPVQKRGRRKGKASPNRRWTNPATLHTAPLNPHPHRRQPLDGCPASPAYQMTA